MKIKLLLIALLLISCDEEKVSPAGASQVAGGGTGDVIVTGTLAIDSSGVELEESYSFSNQEVKATDDTGKVIATTYAGSDGSYVLPVPGQLVIGSGSESGSLLLNGSGLVVESIVTDTKDKSVVGIRAPIEANGPGLVNMGTQQLEKITAIRGKATLDGARDHAGIVIYIPGTSYSARTDSSGNFLMTFLVPGNYELAFEKDGYLKRTIVEVSVTENNTTLIEDVSLKLSGGASTFSVKQIGQEGFSKSRIVEFLIVAGDADRFKGGLEDEVPNIEYAAVPELFRYEFPEDGTYALKMIFANADGFESVVTRNIIVDTIPPSVNGTTLADRTTLSTSHTNERVVIAYHPTCDDIEKIAILTDDSEPRDVDFVWDCMTTPTDNDFHFLIPGEASNFNYKIWVMDQVGNVSTASGSGSIIFDDVAPSAPSIVMKDQTNGSTLGTDITTVDVTFSSCEDTAKVLFSESQTSIPQPHQFVHDCSTTEGAFNYTFANNIAGNKTLIAWAMDHAGNIGPISGTANIQLDQTIPLAKTFTLSDPTVITAGYANNETVDISIVDCSDVTHVLVSETQLTKPSELDSGWQECSTTGLSVTLGGEGSRTAYLWSKDIGGNVSDSSLNASINIDTTSPDISSFTLSLSDSSSSNSIATNAQTINYQFSPCNDDAKHVYVSESSTPPEEGDFSVACSGGALNGTFTFATSTNETKTIYAWIRDIAGNVSLASKVETIILDTVAPGVPTTLTLADTDTASTAYTNSQDLDYTLDSCPPGADYVLLKQDQNSAPLESDSGWTACVPSGSWPSLVSSGSGSKTVYVWTKDEAGNISASSINASITWDSDAPSDPVISTPSSYSSYVQSTTFAVSGTAEANGTVEISGASATANLSIDGSGNWSGNIVLNSEAFNTLVFRAKDQSGNLSSGVYKSVKHDTSAPTISNVAVTVRNDEATVTWNTNESADSVVEWGLSTAYGTTASTGGYSTYHSVNITGLSDGTQYYFKIVSTDNAGNTDVGNNYTGSFKTYIGKSGTISSNETWNDTTTSYLVTSNILVSNGVTLTISPGVTVRMDSQVEIWVEGEIVARGTSGSKINIVPQSTSASYGYWKSLNLRSNSTPVSLDGSDNYLDGNILEHVNIYNGGYQEDVLNIIDTGVAVFDCYFYKSGESYYGNTSSSSAIGGTKGSNLYVKNTTIEDVARVAIKMTESGSGSSGILKVDNTSFSHIHYRSIETTQGGAITITDNSFEDYLPSYSGVNSVINIASHASSATNISRNIFNGTGANSHRVLVVEGVLTIEDNIFYRAPVEAISVSSATGTHSIKRNVFYDPTLAIYLGSGAGGTFNIEYNSFLQGGHRSDSSVFYTTNNGTFNINNNLIYNNDGYSASHRVIHTSNSSSQNITINNNNIIDNDGTRVVYNNRTSEKADINAQSNYWGTTVLSEIGDMVYDYDDDFSLGAVDVSNYLTSLNTAAPILPVTGVSAASNGSGGVRLTWSANEESDIAGYKIYYGTESNWPHDGTGANEGNSGISVGIVLTYDITGLPTGSYYFYVTAIDGDVDGSLDQQEGHESWFSQGAYYYQP